MLKHESKVADFSATMADLDTYHDKVIVFEAVRASDTSRLFTRQPLQPTNTQMPSSPRVSSPKPDGVKPSFHGTLDENFRAMHGQTLHTGTHANVHSIPQSPGPISQIPRSRSQTSSSAFQPSILSHSSIKSRSTPHSGATTPLSTSDHASGDVHMAGSARYDPNGRDRVQASYPDYCNAASSYHQSHRIKSELCTETKLHDAPPTVGPPVSTADFEDQKQKSFQLHSLL